MVISWIVITVLILVGIFAIRINHLKHRFFIILLVLLALFLFTSLNAVTNKNNLDLKSAGGIFDASKLYLGWMANGFQNIKSLTGNVLNLDWKSSNSSFFEGSDDSESKNSKRGRK